MQAHHSLALEGASVLQGLARRSLGRELKKDHAPGSLPLSLVKSGVSLHQQT